MLTEIKSIFTVSTADFGPEEQTFAIPYALSLASLVDAHVTVELPSVKLNLSTLWARSYTQRFVNQNNNRLKKLAEAAAEETRKRAAAANVVCHIRSDHLDFWDVLQSFALQAPTHDLSIIDTEPDTMHFDRGIIESLLIESGRPIIIVPKHWDRFKCDNLIIAWDGSGKAARAVSDAAPFLETAKVVTILAVKEPKKVNLVQSANQLLLNLKRHSIDARIRIENDESRNTATVIQEATEGADMLIMGAYAHSRLREYIFGGVTQSLLHDHKIPLFVSY
jgi:nucleotide-binding universal stress UspA family protein